MRDRHFMEDENELPFLVESDSMNRGRYDSGGVRNKNYTNVPYSEFQKYVEFLMLPQMHVANIVNSVEVEPKNCRVSIKREDDEIRFQFVVQNEYVKSQFNATYDLNYGEMTFFLPYHSYDGLDSMDWFKREVSMIKRQTGLEFDGCGGGYDFSHNDGKDVVIKDEIEVLAYFSPEDMFSDSHSYMVDFDKRKLNKYHEHPWFEFFEPTFIF